MIDEDRLETLIDAYFDQALDEGARQELEAMLIGSSRARRILHERAEQHGLMREWALREGRLDVLPFPDRPRRRRRTLPWVAAGIAAAVAVIVWPRAKGPDAGPEERIARIPTREDVALLAELIGVEWADDSPGFTVGSAVPKGRLKISKGMLRLDFYSGARVFLEGPAELELLTPDLARLESGRLTARVPPPAQGFTVLSSQLQVIDRGTEFGMSVGESDCEVHVFDGEVELHPKVGNAPVRSLFQGAAVSFRAGNPTELVADRGAFANPGKVLEAAELAREHRWQEWREASDRRRGSPGLMLYYDFRQLKLGDGIVANAAAGARSETDGTLVGCERVPGRWLEKPALGFARTSDRVRFRFEGSSPSATMIAWVRVDSLPHDHNALLSTAPGEVGEVHWKLNREGRLLLGLRAAPELEYRSWERLVSPPVVTENDLGRWMQLATVIDAGAREMRHYVNGREVAAGPLLRSTPVRVGKANLGNFDAATPSSADAAVTRNFNGRIDEFAFLFRAMTPEEIAAFR